MLNPADYISFSFLVAALILYLLFLAFNSIYWRRFSAFTVQATCGRLLAPSDELRISTVDFIKAFALPLALVNSMLNWLALGHQYTDPIQFGNATQANAGYRAVIALSEEGTELLFFSSGVLAAVSWLQRKERDRLERTSVEHALAYILHRILRLSIGICFLTLILYNVLNVIMPQFYQKYITEHCSGFSALYVLLFAHNLAQSDARCLPWLWFPSVNLQLYLLVPPLIETLTRHFRLGVTLLFVSALLSALCRATFDYLGLFDDPSTAFLDRQVFTRASPFLVGLAVGYVVERSRRQSSRLSTPHLLHRYSTWIGALLAGLLLALTVCFVFFDGYMRLHSDAIRLLLAAAKLGWLAAVTWVVIVDAYQIDYAWFRRLCSLRVWKATAVLTYAIYLTHWLSGWLIMGSGMVALPDFTKTDWYCWYLLWSPVFGIFAVAMGVCFHFMFIGPFHGLLYSTTPQSEEQMPIVFGD